MPKKKKKKRGPTKPRKRGGKHQVLHELREFKKKLYGWVDKTKVRWTGVPWQEGSKFFFVLDDELVNMVMGLVQRANVSVHAEKAAEIAQERNESLKKMLEQAKGQGTSLEEITQAPQDTETADGATEEEKT